MADIINLRRARKARSRAEKEQKAAENRVRFGRSKAEKQRQALRTEKAARDLEGHRLEDETSD